jgi:Cft2 family RNA processing exonuclease
MSAKDVTGSCTYVETPNHKILVDCGLYQSDNLIDDFKLNKRHFLPSGMSNASKS